MTNPKVLKGHGRLQCKKCDKVLMSCRCPKSHEITWTLCDDCEKMPGKKDIVEEAKIRLEKARKVVSDMCSGDGKWLMQIPANPNQDSDIIISNSLNDVDRLIQEVEKLREETGMDSEIFYPAMSKKIDSLTRERGMLKTKLESETLFKNNNYELCKELEARNELSRIAYNQIEERVEKLKAENAELRHNFEQDRKVIANLKAQLSESQERMKELRGCDEHDFKPSGTPKIYCCSKCGIIK